MALAALGALSLVALALASSTVYHLASGKLSSGNLAVVSGGVGDVAAVLCLLPALRRGELRKLLKPKSTLKRGALLFIACTGLQLAGGLITTRICKVEYNPPVAGASLPLAIPVLLALAPVAEELVFRGAILAGLRQYGDYKALAASSLAFTLLHFKAVPTPMLPTMLLIALALGYSVLKWDTIAPSIVAHSLINLQALAAYLAS